MKHFLMFAAMLTAVSLAGWADDFEPEDFSSGGYNFTTTSATTCCVTGGPSGDITIPGTVTNAGKTYTVTTVGKEAWYQDGNLTSITMPNTLKAVGYKSFKACSNLTKVVFSNTLDSVGHSGFEACVKLVDINLPASMRIVGDYSFYETGVKNMVVPEGVTKVDKYAFCNCKQMESISFPSTLTFYGSGVLTGDAALQTITVAPGCKVLSSYEGLLYDGTKSTLKYCPMGKTGEVTLASNCTTVDAYAFKNCVNITKITCPDGLKKLDWASFAYCTGLKELYLGKSLTYVGRECFDGCTGLTELNLPATVTTVYDYSAFEGMTSLKSLRLPDAVSGGIPNDLEHPAGTLGFSLFSGDAAMTRLQIGPNVTGFRSNCFYKLNALDTLVLGNPVPYKFYDYDSGTKALIEGNYSGFSAENYANVKVIVPTGSLEAYKAAPTWKQFQNISEAPYVGDNPSEDEDFEPEEFSTGGYTFETTSSKTCTVKSGPSGDITIPGTVTNAGKSYSVTAIGDQAWYQDANLKSVTMPNTLKVVKYKGFKACPNLTKVVFSNTLDSIGHSAFEACTSLAEINLPTSMKVIGDYAFYETAVVNMVVPEGVTMIDKYAFCNCKKMESISFPSTLTFYGSGVLTGDAALKTITVAPGCQVLSSYEGLLYDGTKSTLKYCPLGKTGEVTLASNCTTVDAYAFKGCSNITKITCPDGLKRLEWASFQSCTGLKDLYLGKSLTYVGRECFDGCTGLKELKLPATVDTIYDYGVFENMTALKSLRIPDAVNGALPNDLEHAAGTLGSSLFSGDVAITKLQIGQGITGFRDNCFYHVNALDTLILGNPVPYKFYDYDSGTKGLIEGDYSGFSAANYANVKVIVPTGSLEAYKAAPTWKQFKNISEADYVPELPGENESIYPEATYANFKNTGNLGWRGAMHLVDGIKFIDPALVGCKVLGARVVGLSPEGVKNVKIWSSNILSTNDFIEEVPVTVTPEETATGMFTKPIELTAAGAYFGLSVDIDTAAENATWWPIPYSGPINVPGGLYQKADDGSFENYNDSGTLQIVLLMDPESFPENKLKPLGTDEVAAAPMGTSFAIPFKVVNYTGNEITKIDYSYTGDGKTHQGVITQTIPAFATVVNTVQIPIDAIDQAGNYDLQLSLDQVNGAANLWENKTVTIPFSVGEFMTTHRPLMEEMTGTGCGYCPRGMLGLHELATTYPEFIAAAYHRYNASDPMLCSNSGPFQDSGAPNSIMDRTLWNIDPFFGSNGESMGIAVDYTNQAKVYSPANIGIATNWNADSTELMINSKFNFAYVGAGEKYRVGYLITIDGVHCGDTLVASAWKQANYYAGGSNSNPLIETLCNGTFDLSVFNHVVIDCSGTKGVITLTKAQPGATLEHVRSFSIDNLTADVKDWVTDPRFCSKDDINVIVFLIDNQQRVRNARMVRAGKSVEPDSPAVNIFEIDGDVTAAPVYYDLTGRRVSNPGHGVYIKVQGSKTSKILM